jgi:hypothetical protein
MFRVKKLGLELAFVLLAVPSVITGVGVSEQQINYYNDQIRERSVPSKSGCRAT